MNTDVLIELINSLSDVDTSAFSKLVDKHLENKDFREMDKVLDSVRRYGNYNRLKGRVLAAQDIIETIKEHHL